MEMFFKSDEVLPSKQSLADLRLDDDDLLCGQILEL